MTANPSPISQYMVARQVRRMLLLIGRHPACVMAPDGHRVEHRDYGREVVYDFHTTKFYKMHRPLFFYFLHVQKTFVGIVYAWTTLNTMCLSFCSRSAFRKFTRQQISRSLQRWQYETTCASARFVGPSHLCCAYHVSLRAIGFFQPSCCTCKDQCPPPLCK